VGGGLRRSLGCDTSPRERIDYDVRVPGSGDFVTRLKQEEELRGRFGGEMSLLGLLERVAIYYGLDPAALSRRSRKEPISAARAVACALWVEHFRGRGKDIGSILGLSSGGVSMAVRRGAAILTNQPKLTHKILEVSK
jgi:chromosomal replication initiation ATPase DnaA